MRCRPRRARGRASVYRAGFRSKTLFCSRPHPPTLRRHALPLGVAIGPPGPSSRMVPKLARELASEHDGTPSFLAELQIGDARRGGHLHPRVSRGYDDLCSDVVRIIDMNNLEAEGTSRKRFPEPGQLLLFSCARTAPRRHRVVQEPERAVAARPTPARGRRGSPRMCLATGRRWGRRRRAAERLSSKRSLKRSFSKRSHDCTKYHAEMEAPNSRRGAPRKYSPTYRQHATHPHPHRTPPPRGKSPG